MIQVQQRSYDYRDVLAARGYRRAVVERTAKKPGDLETAVGGELVEVRSS